MLIDSKEKMKALLVSLLVLLTGCATQITKLDVQDIEGSAQIRVTDMRPALEKKAEIFSYLITSDAYAIYRLAEEVTTPSAARLLQHRVYESTRSQREPVELKIHHLVVYKNLQAELRRMAIAVGVGGVIGGAVGGVVGPAMLGEPLLSQSGTIHSIVDPASFNLLTAKEHQLAWYSEFENPRRSNVHFVYIETEINGKRVFTRSMVPIAKATEPVLALASALEESIKFHLTQPRL